MAVTRTRSKSSSKSSSKSAVKSKPRPTITPSSDDIPLFMLIHGKSGIGKSSFCAHAPDPCFIIDHDETGILRLMQRGIVPQVKVKEPCTTFTDLASEIDSFSPEDGQTLVIDSLSGCQQLAFEHVCQNEDKFNGDMSAFYDFYAGPAITAQRYWPMLMTALRHVRDRGVNVILIAHSTEVTYKNPDGPDYDKFVPTLDSRIWKATERVVEAVLFFNFEIDITGSRKGAKGKAVDVDRFIITDKTPTADAKNWYGLPPIIPMGDSGQESWDNFYTAYQKGPASD